MKLNLRSALSQFNFGSALFELKRYEDALASYDRAIAIQPELAEAYHGRGTVPRTLGKIEEARHSLEKAVALAPRKVKFYGSLAESKRFVDGDPNITLINALAHGMESLPEGDQIHLHFTLAKVYADLRQYERSFNHLIDGNALKRKQIVYDEAAGWRSSSRCENCSLPNRCLRDASSVTPRRYRYSLLACHDRAPPWLRPLASLGHIHLGPVAAL